MKKYINAEELKQKLKSLKDIYNHPNRVIHGVADAFMQDGRVAMCDDIMREIESLQQAQPEVDFEKEFAHEYAIYPLPTFISASLKDGTELIDFIYKTARHFAERGAVHLNVRKEE